MRVGRASVGTPKGVELIGRCVDAVANGNVYPP